MYYSNRLILSLLIRISRMKIDEHSDSIIPRLSVSRTYNITDNQSSVFSSLDIRLSSQLERLRAPTCSRSLKLNSSLSFD